MKQIPELRDDPAASARRIETTTIGEAWIRISALIMKDGVDGTYDALAVREIILATLTVSQPQSEDDVVSRFADARRVAWMHDNFTSHDRVVALGDADSYATRLRDYDHRGRDQVRWVVERLRSDPLSRSATITTFQPLSDTSYIPCVCLLDFFLIEGALQLSCYAHSIDFGAKGFANLIELAALQEEVARDLTSEVGALTMFIKSAHVYESDFAFMNEVLTSRITD